MLSKSVAVTGPFALRATIQLGPKLAFGLELCQEILPDD
jgi:hypothetical protein